MDTVSIGDNLTRLFNEKNARIVFWDDPEGNFVGTLPSISLDNVHVINLSEIASLAVKVLIELEDPTGKYLLYAPFDSTKQEEDWLLDIRLYSHRFKADLTHMILRNLGLQEESLIPIIERHSIFFRNKERMARLKRSILPEDTADVLERKLLTVVTKADHPDVFNIVLTLFHTAAKGQGFDPPAEPPSWPAIRKFNLETPFWNLIEAEFGFVAEKPSFQKLIIQILVSDLHHSLKAELPSSLKEQVLPRTKARNNAVVFAAQWRDSNTKSCSYNQWADWVWNSTNMKALFDYCDYEELLDVETFAHVERIIATGLLRCVEAMATVINPETVRSIVVQRKTKHWVASNSISEETRNVRRSVYDAIMAAAELLDLRNTYERGFDYANAVSLYKAYESELYRFDQLYRHFCGNADIAESRGLDILKPLRENIEACYANWYLDKIALAWGEHLERDILRRWSLDRVHNQYNFFELYVEPWLRRGPDRRAFVIISDALRFEIAEELTRKLKNEDGLLVAAELVSQLGVLPSYTSLGMASLLPHSELTYNATGDVLVDGRPTGSLKQRNAILAAKANGKAIKADDLIAMSREKGRAFVKGASVVFIYHNEIDARGDKAATEGTTFDAVRDSLHSLITLIRRIINCLNGSYVLVTADHGFLYTETNPTIIDKTTLGSEPEGAVKAKKRYLLGKGLPKHPHVWSGDTAVTAKAQGGMQFWVPKSRNLFHFVGGSRFVHGGAMLQEIVVPVIKVTELTGKGRQKEYRSRPVQVLVIGDRHRITSPKYRFHFQQMDPVGGQFAAVTLKIAVYEGNEAITNIETVTFDSMSSHMRDRSKEIFLTLRDKQYDKRTRYRLVLRNVDLDTIIREVPVIIDRAIIDDF